MVSLEQRVKSNILELIKTIKEDRTSLPYLGTASAGFIVAMLDFIFLQNLKFQVFALGGLFILLVGGYLRSKARLELKKKAGFVSLVATGKLQIVEGHQLVRDGLHKHIRHPIYLGKH